MTGKALTSFWVIKRAARATLSPGPIVITSRTITSAALTTALRSTDLGSSLASPRDNDKGFGHFLDVDQAKPSIEFAPSNIIATAKPVEMSQISRALRLVFCVYTDH
jgi:hypothetical protein